MVENYDDSAMAKDAEFVDRIAARLRAPEHAHPTFEQRLMEKVRAEGAALYPPRASAVRGWLRNERTFRVNPVGGLAVAAGIAAIIAVSGIEVGLRISARTSVAASSVAASSVAASSVAASSVAASSVAIQSAATAAPDTVQIVRFVFVDSGAKSVELVGDFNEWAKGSTVLRRSGAPGVWSASVPLSPGRHEYAFIINGSRWAADPLALKSSDDFGTESSVIRVGTSSKSAT